MNISFSDLPIGPYTEEMVKEQWNGVIKTRGVKEGRCEVVNLDGENVLQVTFQKGEVGPDANGVSWNHRLGGSFDEYTVEYKVRVSEDFNYIRGGKLPGLTGGSSPSGGASTKNADGFSVRVMWREIGVLEQYVYHMNRKEGKQWGTDYLWSTSENKGQVIDGDLWNTLSTQFKDRVYLTSGKWHTVKIYIKMNTPGNEDGKIISWFDGVEVLNLDMEFRKDESFAIDSFKFTTFFGGNEPSWAPERDEKIYFKDFVFDRIRK
ncbi:hypothetical protein COB55_02620 [Candidatus Wolfebacteria bacterium]|nr:MAG: hypothetical protein COB55_02620 [Candidatus Wolfebacteria bacterium]